MFLKKIAIKIKSEIDSEFEITFIETDEILSLPSGKHKYIQSNLKNIEL